MRIGIAQIRIDRYIKKNLENLICHMDKCVKSNIDILCFPECCITSYVQVLDKGLPSLQDAFKMNWAIDSLHKSVMDKKINVIVGTIHIEHDKIYNAAIVLLTNGKRLMYCKNNLTSKEKKYFTPGMKTLVFELNDIKCGILICRDQNYPLLARRYRDAGVHVIFIPAAHYYPPGEAKLKVDKNRALPIARALENKVYVFKANAVGEQNNYVSLGGSIIINPNGYVISEADDSNEVILSNDLSKESFN